jgi:cold shock protein
MIYDVANHTQTGTTTATVREWRDADGWGVLDSPDTPGGCWAHFSNLDMPGYRALDAGQVVRLEWEAPGQDGYGYRATRVVP